MTPAEKRVRAQLRDDGPFFAEKALRIVGRDGREVPLVPNAGQTKLYAALERQRAAGKPMRAIILKARKLGFSTSVQGLAIQRAISRRNHKALVVAQDHDTAGELFDIGRFMYSHLPAEIQPPLRNDRNSKGGMKLLAFGIRSRLAQQGGDLGLNSTLEVDSAQDPEAGRGFTYRTLHASEVAFWPYPAKLTSLLNAVPDEDEDSLIVLESTANGHNFFKDRWDAAVQGLSSYAPVFAAWWEEPAYQIRFPTDEDREEFIAGIGTGPWGEDEPRLQELFGCTPEQLAWRRRAIVDKCESKIEVWDQEYPAAADDAFMVTGKKVFSGVLVKRVLSRAERFDPAPPMVAPSPQEGGPTLGILKEGETKTVVQRSATVEVPTSAVWVPRAATGFGDRHAFWKVFGEHPVLASEDPEDDRKAGHYVIGCDVSGGEENTIGQRAWHALQVVDHATGIQVASWRSRCDEDQLALEALLAGLYFNNAWILVEISGGWGNPIVSRLRRLYRYARLYRRRPNPDATRETLEKRMGWDTNRRTKPMLISEMKEALREETDGIRCRLTAGELATYVRDAEGRMDAEDGAFADLLMAYMIAQHGRQEIPVPKDREPGRLHSTSRRLPQRRI